MVKFLAANELLLCGSLESPHDEQQAYMLDTKLHEITKGIPQN